MDCSGTVSERQFHHHLYGPVHLVFLEHWGDLLVKGREEEERELGETYTLPNLSGPLKQQIFWVSTCEEGRVPLVEGFKRLKVLIQNSILVNQPKLCPSTWANLGCEQPLSNTQGLIFKRVTRNAFENKAERHQLFS